MQRLEAFGRTVERIPVACRIRGDQTATRVLFTMAGERASKIRQLKVWAAAPIANTYENLYFGAVTIFTILHKQGWAALGAAPIDISPGPRRTQLVLLYGAIAVLIGALVETVIFAESLGPVTTVAASTVSVALVALLSRSGLAIDSLQGGHGPSRKGDATQVRQRR